MIPKRIYNPAQLSPDELKASFVARHRTLAHMVDIVAEQRPGHPCQHIVLVGPRGMGKTTLGLRLLQEIRERPDLASIWQPVPFPEESYGITDLANFWIAALRHLSCATGDNRWDAKADALGQGETNSQRQAEYALAELLDCCQEIGKRLILFVENLDLVLDQLRDEREVHALRAALMAHPEIMVIGSANSVFDAISNHGQPFYEFFRLIRLQGLSQEECSQLLEALVAKDGRTHLAGKMDQERGRLETIRHLTGGNPRLLVLACRMLIESPLSSAFEDLERLIDEQTPYFKANIEALPIQARGVFHCLAEAWAPMLAKEVSAAAKLNSSHASAQLRQLKEKGYVREIHLREEKRARYEVADRFYNIYYVLRFSRSGRERLARLVGFLHDLFGATAMRNLYPATLEALRTGDFPTAEAADWLVVLADRVGQDTEYSERRQWWLKAVDLIFEKGIDLDALEQIDAAFDTGGPLSAARRSVMLALRRGLADGEKVFRELIGRSPNNPVGWIGLALGADDPESLNRAIVALRQRSASVSLGSKLTSRSFAWSILFAECQALLKLGRDQEAANAIRRSLNLVDLNDPHELLQWRAAMLLYCGQDLAKTGLGEQASPLFAQVAKLARPFHPWHWRAVAAETLLLMIGVHLQAERAENLRAATQEILQLVRTDDPRDMKTTAILALSSAASWFAAKGQAKEVMDYLKRTSGYVRPTTQDDRRRKCAELLASTAIGLSAGGTIKPKLAESICRTATDIYPTCAAAWQGLATAILAEGSEVRLAEAFKALERSVGAQKRVPEEELGGLTRILVTMLATGHAAKVKELMANANLSERLESLWHAARAELGESIEPLPAEVFEAVKEVRRRIAVARE